MVPVAAIQRGPNGAYIFAVKPDKTVQMRNVTVGFSEGNFAAITQGINPGDMVVTDGQDKLQDNTHVEIRQGGSQKDQSQGQAQGQ